MRFTRHIRIQLLPGVNRLRRLQPAAREPCSLLIGQTPPEMTKSKTNALCYMCDQAATTGEHVPPRSFFPKSKRVNLWKVPSCEDHNNDNKMDVEYVRGVIATQLGTNATAQRVLEVSMRSWDYRPALFKRTFHDLEPVLINGKESGAFSFDLPRVKSVMSAVARALAYRDFGRQFMGKWRVLCATLGSRKPTPGWDKVRDLLTQASYDPIPTPVPDVFEYGIHRTKPVGFIYRLVFYGGFVVFAWPVLAKRESGGV